METRIQPNFLSCQGSSATRHSILVCSQPMRPKCGGRVAAQRVVHRQADRRRTGRTPLAPPNAEVILVF